MRFNAVRALEVGTPARAFALPLNCRGLIGERTACPPWRAPSRALFGAPAEKLVANRESKFLVFGEGAKHSTRGACAVTQSTESGEDS